MEKVQQYKNKDLVGITEESFNERIRPNFKIRNDFIAKTEIALMYLGGEHSDMYVAENFKRGHLRNFDGALLMDQEAQLKKDIYYLSPFGDFQVTPEMFPNLSIRTLTIGKEIIQLNRHRFLDLKEKRHLPVKYKHCLEHRFAYFDHKLNKWFMMENGYGIHTEDNVNLLIPASLSPNYIIKPSDIKAYLKERKDEMVDITRTFNIGLQIALTHYYEWHCFIREKSDSISFSLPIHPSSSKEVFIMRNVPEGKTRRKAICNYVKDHYRTVKNVKGEDTQILIQKHLRGELKFNWRGLEVIVKPSQYDLKRFQDSKKAAQARRLKVSNT